jgi:hypothetical protein
MMWIHMFPQFTSFEKCNMELACFRNSRVSKRLVLLDDVLGSETAQRFPLSSRRQPVMQKTPKLDKATRLRATAAIQSNGCAKRRLGDLNATKLFTANGMPPEWYALGGGSFACVCLTQKSAKKLGECHPCKNSEERMLSRLLSLEFLGEPVYSSVDDMKMNKTRATFRSRTVLSCTDKLWAEWRGRKSLGGFLHGEHFRNIQPALLWMQESAAREMCAAGPVKELVQETVLAMLSVAQRTVAGPAAPSSPVAAVDFYVKVGMTTSLLDRIAHSDGIPLRSVAKFIGSDAVPGKQKVRALVSKELDERCDGDGLTCVAFSVVLGLFRSNVPSMQARSSDGMERCVYEITAQMVRDKKESISKMCGGRIEVQLDASGHTSDAGLYYIGAGDTDPRLACFNTLTKHIIDACENLNTHHTEHPLGSKADHAVPLLKWQSAVRAIIL